MIRDILILTESPFSKRDYDRFGTQILEQYFKVQVLDCTPWLKPHFWEKYSGIVHPFPGYTSVYDRDGFKDLVAGVERGGGVAIDYLNRGAEAQCIRQELRDRGILIAIVHNGLLPQDYMNVLGKLRLFYQQGRLVRNILIKLSGKFLSKRPIIPADIAILSGEDGLKDPCAQAVHKIWAHSFDYDLYLKHRGQVGKRSKPYAVFLDADMAYHSDFLHLGIKPYVMAEKYYPALLALFEMVEHNTGLEVIFAAHPRSRYDLRPHLLAGRTPVLGRTAELVRDANIVLCHTSTAISFAVLWRKPIIFLTSNELERSLCGLNMALFKNVLQVPLVNIDCLKGLNIDLKAWSHINESAYADYKKDYIKKPGTPEQPVWEIFADYVQKM